MPTTRLHIAGFHDVSDTAHLEKTLEAIPGVEAVEIDPEAQQAILRHVESADPHAFPAALRGLGYTGTLL